MKREMDLIRDLLLRIEADDSFNGSGYGRVTLEESIYSQAQILYHMKLLADSDYIDVVHWLAHGEPFIRGLTSAGHDFLDAVRDPEVWAKTKTGAAAAGGFTLELVRDLAKGFLRKQIEEYTGVKLA